jgi:tripartite-type tricarboxylate transporter receptor subunit TctC
MLRSIGAGVGAALFALATAGPAGAAYPDKPITLVVPWAPGGTTDILARVLAEHMTRSLGQPTVVENKPGASGNIGSAIVARAKPDGYTLLVGTMSTHAINPALMANMPFKGVDDFTPLAKIAFVLNTMVVHQSVPAKSVAEFVAHARANPEKVAFASAGPGSTNHLSAVLLERATGIKMLHVPYKGGAPAIADTAAGHVQLFFSAATQTMPHVKAGSVRLLGVTEAKRSALVPEIPTVGETVPGYELAVWYGAFGPAGMPADIADRLNAEINRIMALPDVKAKMSGIGVDVLDETRAQFAEALKRDYERYGQLIRELGIKADE